MGNATSGDHRRSSAFSLGISYRGTRRVQPTWVQIVCPGHRVKIRRRPLLQDGAIGYLRNGDEIEIVATTLGGFFQLADGIGFVYKYTRHVTWIELGQAPSGNSRVAIDRTLSTRMSESVKSERTSKSTESASFKKLPIQALPIVAVNASPQMQDIYDNSQFGNMAEPSEFYQVSQITQNIPRVVSMKGSPGQRHRSIKLAAVIPRYTDFSSPNTCVRPHQQPHQQRHAREERVQRPVQPVKVPSFQQNIDNSKEIPRPDLVYNSNKSSRMHAAPVPPHPLFDRPRFSSAAIEVNDDGDDLEHQKATSSVALKERMARDYEEISLNQPAIRSSHTSELFHDRTIVIDHGSFMMRAGFIEDEDPTSIFPNCVASQPSTKGGDNKSYFVGESAQLQPGNRSPYTNGVIESWEDMEAIWEHCFTDCLRVDTSTTRVFLTEAHNVHKETREKTVETMFELFDVEATYLHVQPVLALFAAGLTSGCVIDSGEYSTTVYPVADGYHLVNASVKLPYGGSQITEILTHLLLDTGYGPRFGEQPALHQTVTTKKLEIVRDMKEKFAYVRADPNSSTAARMTYNLPDGKSVLLESELYKCTEQFFNPQQFNHMFSESEDTPIQEAIFKAINACSMDVRKTLFSNIVLAGGNTMFKGFQKRLANELKQIVPQGMASSVRITGSNDRSKAIWNGGAILAAMSTFEDRWIMGADYDEIGPNIVHDKCAVYL